MNRLLILFVLIALSAFCTLADPTVQNAPKKSWISNLKGTKTSSQQINVYDHVNFDRSTVYWFSKARVW